LLLATDLMSDTVISVEGLSKKYIIGREQEGGYKTLRDVMATAARRAGSRFVRPFYRSAAASNGHKEEFWALKDVSLEIEQGSVLGVIGPNGAGKSTLLKILSRVTEPTSGRVRIRGRVASLLEAGTGFHPELTGRENVFLNGAILGMTRAEIKRKFDEIVSFAEVDRFIDTPVKRYSSGMYVRLAFAVAAHLEPEIFLVDEILSVGDAAFQDKCLGKMDKVATQGRTVLFVSHNMASIKRLCTSAVFLAEGRVSQRGDPGSVIAEYVRQNLGSESIVELGDHQHLVRSVLQITQVSVLNSADQPSGTLFFGERISIRLVVHVAAPVTQACVGIGFCVLGVRISTIHTSPTDFPAHGRSYILTCRVPPNTLLPNFYSLHLGAYSFDSGRALDWVPDAVSFRIQPVHIDGVSDFDHRDSGLVRLSASWELGSEGQEVKI
jgi:lipopolysaccharide transport system ATP-binding protein